MGKDSEFFFENILFDNHRTHRIWIYGDIFVFHLYVLHGYDLIYHMVYQISQQADSIFNSEFCSIFFDLSTFHPFVLWSSKANPLYMFSCDIVHNNEAVQTWYNEAEFHSNLFGSFHSVCWILWKVCINEIYQELMVIRYIQIIFELFSSQKDIIILLVSYFILFFSNLFAKSMQYYQVDKWINADGKK